jgi:alpha-L-fucosidase
MMVCAASLALFLSAGALSSRRTPSAEQLLYQQRELTMFAHFSMCTFAPHNGCEQDTACMTNPPSLFDPGNTLNTTQWVETASKMGAKEICLTAHHTGGFALFQSNYTNYSIRQSPYQGGRGDIVRDFTASCRQFGISPCLYFINAWDCYEAHHDTASVYLERTLGMLTELSNRQVYGKIDRFWFDQYGFAASGGKAPAGLFPAAWPQIVEHVHTVSPGTMMLPGPDGCLNPGEGGVRIQSPLPPRFLFVCQYGFHTIN